MRKISIMATRLKGPPTPNFGKFSHILEGDTSLAIAFDREKLRDQHGGIGIKMAFVCDVLETIEQLDKHENKVFHKEMDVFLNQGIFFAMVLNLDVFLFELYSILDYLAVELAEIFGLKVRKRGELKDVDSFVELKKTENLHTDIRQMVDALMSQAWFDYFHRLRNRITHRTPINLAAHAKYENGKITKVEFPFLPDNPDEIVSTFTSELSLVSEPKKWLEGIFAFVDNICGVLITLVKT